jgi:hypothetical protein
VPAMDELVGLVRDDHVRISHLFEELTAVADKPPDLAARWAELSRVLRAHFGAFEEICQLPLLRAAWDGVPSPRDIAAQKMDIGEAVAEAGLQPAGSTRWWLAVRAAQAAAAEHVSVVEAGPLKRFAQQASESTRRELGRQWKRYMADFSDDHREGAC